MTQGRLCPRCGQINAPSVTACTCSDKPKDPKDMLDRMRKNMPNHDDLSGLRPIHPFPGQIPMDLIQRQPCLWDNLPLYDERGRPLTYALSCPCKKCSPSF